jgi:hypothetical protein
MSDNATVNIPNDVLKPIIEAKVVEALGGQRQLLEELVSVIVNGQVERNYRKMPWIEAVCRDAITNATQEAVQQWVASHQGAMVKAIEREMTHNTRNLAKLMVEGFSKNASDRYKIRVSFEGEENR